MWNVLWRSCLFVLAWAFLLAPLIVPFIPWMERSRITAPLLVQTYVELASAATILAATWLMVRFIDRRPFATAGFERRRAIGDFSVGLLMGSCWIGLPILPLFAAGIASFDASAAFSARTLGWPGLAILFNAITQEGLARGYIFQVLHSRTTAIAAVLVTSLLFTLLHARAFGAPGLPVLNVFLAGILFGLAYLATRNLWLPIGLHFSWNFLLGSILGGRVSGHMLAPDRPRLRLEGPSLWTGGAFGLEGSLAVTVVTAIACCVFFRLASLSKGVLRRTPLNPRPRVGSESRRSGSL